MASRGGHWSKIVAGGKAQGRFIAGQPVGGGGALPTGGAALARLDRGLENQQWALNMSTGAYGAEGPLSPRYASSRSLLQRVDARRGEVQAEIARRIAAANALRQARTKRKDESWREYDARQRALRNG